MEVTREHLQRLRARIIYFYAVSRGKTEVTLGVATIAKLLEIPESEAFIEAGHLKDEIKGPVVRWKNGRLKLTFEGSADYREQSTQVFEHWVQVTGKKRAKFGSKRRGSVTARLKEGFTVSQLCMAVDGNHLSEWHQGKNKHKKKFNDLELICRNATNVEKFEAIAEQHHSPNVISMKDRMRRLSR